MRLGNNIRAVRIKRGLGQAELAEKVGVHLTHINRIEKGKYIPALETVVKLADVLEVSVDGLVNSTDGTPDEIRLEDTSFAEKIKLLNSLSEEEKQAFSIFLDSVLSKKKMIGMLKELAS